MVDEALTVLREDPPACDEAAGSRGEAVRGGRDTHGLHHVVEEDGSVEFQESDVVVGGELVVLGVEEDAADRSGGGYVVSRGHHAHSHVGSP